MYCTQLFFQQDVFGEKRLLAADTAAIALTVLALGPWCVLLMMTTDDSWIGTGPGWRKSQSIAGWPVGTGRWSPSPSPFSRLHPSPFPSRMGAISIAISIAMAHGLSPSHGPFGSSPSPSLSPESRCHGSCHATMNQHRRRTSFDILRTQQRTLHLCGHSQY